jgi:aspartate aminotransferase
MIYEHINFRNFCSIASIPGMLEKTVTVNGVAKHLQWLDGVVILGPEFIKACTKIQGQVTSGANSLNVPPLQLWTDPSVLQHMVDAFHSRRDLVVGLLKRFQ